MAHNGKWSVTFDHAPAMFFAARMRSLVHLANFRFLFVAVLVLATAAVGWSQTSAARPKAEVRNVHFALANVPDASARWLETDVEVEIRPPPGRSGFLDRVKVTLNLGLKASDGTFRFYRADAEAVSLDAGVAHFRFYLPAEIVRRDGLHADAEFWLAEIAAAGETQANAGRNASLSLRELERLRNFLAKVATEAPANDGVLQPQHLTPFAVQYGGATPTMVRRARE